MSNKSLVRLTLLGITVLILFVGQAAATDEQKRLTSTFDQRWLYAVISIEVSDSGRKDPKPIGTGFLVQTSRKHALIITAKHVIADKIGKPSQPNISESKQLCYRLNTAETGSVVVWEDDLQKHRFGEWYLSPKDNVACRFAAWPKSAHIQITLMTRDNFLGDEILMAGAPILVLGFPLGLRETDHSRAIARHGIVGRAEVDNLIADVFVFPGNSGGPVVYSPAFKAGKGLTSQLVSDEKLIGVVSSFIPYREPAISPQTTRVRIVFEENSGLTNVVPVNRLIELIESEEVTKKDASIQ